MSIVKVIYEIRKTTNNSEEFYISNSPLNHYASFVAKFGSCWRYGCSAVVDGIAINAGGAAIDQILQEAGQAKIFLPFIAKGYNFVTGNTRYRQS